MDRLLPGAAAPSGRRGLDANRARPRILVVGPESAWLEGIVDLLQLAGYDAGQLSDWRQAGHAIRSSRVDLAIVDVSEHLDGLDLPARLEALSPGGNTPLLVLSTTADDRIWQIERTEAFQRGRVRLHTHSLLGPAALLAKVEVYFAEVDCVSAG